MPAFHYLNLPVSPGSGSSHHLRKWPQECNYMQISNVRLHAFRHHNFSERRTYLGYVCLINC